jgi:hypothetical protein
VLIIIFGFLWNELVDGGKKTGCITHICVDGNFFNHLAGMIVVSKISKSSFKSQDL